MDIVTFEGSMIEMSLRQINGVSINSIRGVQYYIEFDLECDYKVAYAYNVNADKNYFLQRVKPYPIYHGKFKNESELVEFLKNDIEKFKNAKKSRNFKYFVNAASKLNVLTGSMEELFLNHNVDNQSLLKLNEDFITLLEDIEKIKKATNKIK